MDSRLTKTEFTELVASTRGNRALAERLEELGVNENLSHFVRANTALNEGGFERVFAECDIDLLIAELRDIPGWFWSSSRLIRQLETAREAFAVLGNRKATAEEKKQAEDALGKAQFQWWTHRTKVLCGFWRGVRRAPERFYNRSADAFSGAGKSPLLAEPATEIGSQTPLVEIFRFVRFEWIFYGCHILFAATAKELKTLFKAVFATNYGMYNLATFVIAIAVVSSIFLHVVISSKLKIVDPLDKPPIPKTESKAIT